MLFATLAMQILIHHSSSLIISKKTGLGAFTLQKDKERHFDASFMFKVLFIIYLFNKMPASISLCYMRVL